MKKVKNWFSENAYTIAGVCVIIALVIFMFRVLDYKKSYYSINKIEKSFLIKNAKEVKEYGEDPKYLITLEDLDNIKFGDKYFQISEETYNKYVKGYDSVKIEVESLDVIVKRIFVDKQIILYKIHFPGEESDFKEFTIEDAGILKKDLFYGTYNYEAIPFDAKYEAIYIMEMRKRKFDSYIKF